LKSHDHSVQVLDEAPRRISLSGKNQRKGKAEVQRYEPKLYNEKEKGASAPKYPCMYQRRERRYMKIRDKGRKEEKRVHMGA